MYHHRHSHTRASAPPLNTTVRPFQRRSASKTAGFCSRFPKLFRSVFLRRTACLFPPPESARTGVPDERARTFHAARSDMFESVLPGSAPDSTASSNASGYLPATSAETDCRLHLHAQTRCAERPAASAAPRYPASPIRPADRSRYARLQAHRSVTPP